MRLSELIRGSSDRITSEWEVFARSCLPAANAMDLEQRRDHIAGMLKTIALDLDTRQSKREQHEKSRGHDDAHVDSDTASNSHGTDRAAIGFTPVQIVAEFRALRASVLRLWSEAHDDLDRANLEDVTRFNEAIDQLLTESIARYDLEVGRAKGLLLSVLGHDLRNPLGAIKMLATVMIGKESPAWPNLDAASRILLCTSRMAGMISDLLTFTSSRLGAGIPIVRTEIDIATVCQLAIDEISAFHPQSRFTLKATGALRGSWDAARIGQVLSNLLANAYQYGAEQPIELTLRGEPDEIVLAIHNHGPAIPREDLQDIFTPFRQLDGHGIDAKNLGGVGLGLYIVEAIVSAHRGTIDVESTAEHGTTFTVRLPRATA